MIVLDASVAIELLLDTEVGGRVAATISDPHESLHAPQLLTVEVAQVLRRLNAAGKTGDKRRASEALRLRPHALRVSTPLLPGR